MSPLAQWNQSVWLSYSIQLLRPVNSYFPRSSVTPVGSIRKQFRMLGKRSMRRCLNVALASQHVWYKDSGLESCGGHGIHALTQEVSRILFSESSLNENILPFLLTFSKWHPLTILSSFPSQNSGEPNGKGVFCKCKQTLSTVCTVEHPTPTPNPGQRGPGHK